MPKYQKPDSKADSGFPMPMGDDEGAEGESPDVSAAAEDSAAADMLEALAKGDRKALGAALKSFGEACGWAGSSSE